MVERRATSHLTTHDCLQCGKPFARSSTCMYPFDIPVLICFDCFMLTLIGEACECVITGGAKHSLAIRGTAERFSIAARSFPNTFWYALTEGHRLVMLNEPIIFHSVAA
jgi:hypothetical protein